jgi:hypothetical protein
MPAAPSEAGDDAVDLRRLGADRGHQHVRLDSLSSPWAGDQIDVARQVAVHRKRITVPTIYGLFDFEIEEI